jgi:hypothetical protein
MRRVRAYVKAIARTYSFNPGKNPYVGFGFAWGLPVPLFSIAFDLSPGKPGRGALDAISEHPVQIFFLLHPFIFAAVLGVMGTVRHDL